MANDKLAKKEDVQFAALANVGDVDPMEIIEVNLGGQLTPDLLTRVKMPGSGSTVWEVPNINGETDAVKSIDGVVVGISPKRVCFEKSYDESEGGEQPICSSDDGIFGKGSDKFPARPCQGCPFNEFGSDGKRGKKCQERRVVMILQQESFLPIIIDVSVMSLKPLKKYLADLTGMKKFFFNVITSMKLEKCENKDGKPYSELRPGYIADLDNEQKVAARKMWQSLSGFMRKIDAIEPERQPGDEDEKLDF